MNNDCGPLVAETLRINIKTPRKEVAETTHVRPSSCNDGEKLSSKHNKKGENKKCSKSEGLKNYTRDQDTKLREENHWKGKDIENKQIDDGVSLPKKQKRFEEETEVETQIYMHCDGSNSVKPRPINASEDKMEPIPGKTCSLATKEGRGQCLAAENARWEAYRSAISSVSSSNKSLKRKIPDYFKKINK